MQRSIQIGAFASSLTFVFVFFSLNQVWATDPLRCEGIVGVASSSPAIASSTPKEQTYSKVLDRVTKELTGGDEDPLEPSQPLTVSELKAALNSAFDTFNETHNLKIAVLAAQLQFRLSQVQTLKLFAVAKRAALRGVARGVYRPLLMRGNSFFKELGGFWKSYFVPMSMGLAKVKQNFMERLFNDGKDEGSYGSEATTGLVTVLSKIATPSNADVVRFQGSTRKIGQDLELPSGERISIKSFELSPMISLSGMSYPQLSANAILSLLYIHIYMAKQGVRYTYNTGEGGPSFHMALLNPNTSQTELTNAITHYAVDNNMVKSYSLGQVQIERAVEQIMEDRDRLFKDFTPDDINKAQIMGQLGPALNGARTKENRIDLNVLKNWSEQPFYAGTQFKLKQAAKKGAKVNGSKIGAIPGFLRKIQPGKAVEAPQLSVEWDNVESLAQLIVATKFVTRKPVSIKFAVGQAQEIYDMLEYLRDADALPDQIQLDGSGYVKLPGSGNAPVMDNTSLNITTATITVDAILKKLQIRDSIFLEATGDIVTPSEAMMLQALGADGVAAARLWMGMGLGCKLVMKCATGGCYYGIAAGDGKLFSEALDPRVIGPKGAKAGLWWYDAFTRLQLEGGANPDGATPLRKQIGLNNPYSPVKVRGPFELQSLRTIFSMDEVASTLQGRISENELQSLVFGASTQPGGPVRNPEDIATQAVVEEDLGEGSI